MKLFIHFILFSSLIGRAFASDSSSIRTLIDLNKGFLGLTPKEFCQIDPLTQSVNCTFPSNRFPTEIIKVGNPRFRFDPAEIHPEVEHIQAAIDEWGKKSKVKYINEIRLDVELSQTRPDGVVDTGSTEIYMTEIEIPLGDKIKCLLPAAVYHWAGSLQHPHRFAQTPIVLCGTTAMNFSEMLGLAGIKSLRMTRATSAKTEIDAWLSSDPEKIRYPSSFNRHHPYVKFFMADNTKKSHYCGNSGMGQYCLEFPEVPISFFQGVEKRGAGFLGYYLGTDTLEFTNVSKESLQELLKYQYRGLLFKTGENLPFRKRIFTDLVTGEEVTFN